MDKNKKILIIVESPNKVKTITKILKDAGYKNITVKASVGHIMKLVDNRATYKNTGIDVNNDFKMNLKVDPEKDKIVKELKTLVKASDIVYLMSDGDREGAAISWSLIKFLNIPKSKYLRAVTQEITPKAVLHALDNPIPLETNLIEAAKSRMCVDKMIGYGLSPVARISVGAKSVGRCQSVGLKLIADREKEISSFIPETYFDIYLNFRKNRTEFKAKYIGTLDKPIDHLKTQDDVNLVKVLCKGKYVIKDILTKERQESPKPPFTTLTFQQEAANKLGLKVKDAMSCAQKLFEGLDVNGNHIGLITYLRTDSTDISPEFLPDLKAYVDKTFGKNQYQTPRAGKKQVDSQNGHECLRCVDPNMTPNTLAQYINNDLILKVYNLIWQRTIASSLPNAKISETTYLIENNKQLFKLVSNEIIDLGYRKVYSFADKEENGLVKETFKKGEELKDTRLDIETKATQPKPRYTEASLVKKLQDIDVGRPSTTATIIETVLSPSRGYATLEDKKIVPTDRGMQLAAFLDRNFSNLINLNYTRDMEEDLDKIAEGKETRTDFLTSFYHNLDDSIEKNSEKFFESKDAPKCPLCGATMKLRRSKFGKLFYGCPNFPKCRGVVNVNK